MPVARIFIVRHGNTFAPGETPRRVGAATDLPLVDSGLAQAHALAEHIAGRIDTVAQLLTSPLRRTRQTADILAGRLVDVTPQPVTWLREIDHGPDENRAEADVIRRIGEAALRDWDERGIAPPGWQVDGPARRAAWEEFLASCNGNNVLVTSNGAARFALLARPELGVQLSALKLRTGAYGAIERNATGGLRVVAWDIRPPRP